MWAIKILVVCTLSVGLMLGLSSCGRDGTSSAPTAGDQAAGILKGNLQIASWGPDRTKAGVVFNAQPDGSAALWARVNQSLDGTDVTMDFDGRPLTTAVQGELVTASVPPALYAESGTHAVRINVKQGTAEVQSNTVQFLVE